MYDLEAIAREGKRIANEVMNPKSRWVPTPENIQKDEENRIKARKFLEALDAKRDKQPEPELELVGSSK